MVNHWEGDETTTVEFMGVNRFHSVLIEVH